MTLYVAQVSARNTPLSKRSATDEILTLALRARRGEALSEDALSHLAALVAGRPWPEWAASSACTHYDKHVVRGAEWPALTTPAGYERSLRRVVLDPNTSIVLCVYRGADQAEPEYQLVFHGETLATERGPNGGPYIALHYSLDAGCRRTGYQVAGDADEYIASKEDVGVITNVLWL